MSDMQAFGSWRIILLEPDALGDDGDVLTRVGSNGAEFKPGGGGGGTAWGGITGTLANQTDLQAALNAKAAASSVILHQATVTLTDAQIKALPTTSIQIVAAPGTDKLLVISTVVVRSELATPYGNIDVNGSMGLRYGSDTSALVPTIVNIENNLSNLTSLLESASSLSIFGVRAQVYNQVAPAEGAFFEAGGTVIMTSSGNEFRNKALNLRMDNSGGDLTLGDPSNVIRVSITYYILNTLTGVFE